MGKKKVRMLLKLHKPENSPETKHIFMLWCGSKKKPGYICGVSTPCPVQIGRGEKI